MSLLNQIDEMERLESEAFLSGHKELAKALRHQIWLTIQVLVAYPMIETNTEYGMIPDDNQKGVSIL
jgi:hypothetical protein